MGDYHRKHAKQIAELALDAASKGYEWKQRALELTKANIRLKKSLAALAGEKKREERT